MYRFIKALLIPIIYLLYRPKVEGRDNLPKEGRVVLYSNHTSLIDPVILGCVLPRKIHFMAKVELFEKPVLGGIIKNLGAFPVKRGSADITAIKTALGVLKDEKVFGVFPEGTRGKEGMLGHFSRGTASIAHRAKAPVIPVAIIGEYKPFRAMKIRIGKPLKVDHYYAQRSDTELLEAMSMDMEKALKELLEG